MRTCLSAIGLLCFMLCFVFVTACSGPEAPGPVFDTVDELLERELGDARVLDTKTWNGNTYLLYVRHQGTPAEEVAIGAVRRIDGGYAWISSPSFRIDVAARFDFDPRDGSEAVNVYIGKAPRDDARRITVRGFSEPLDVHDGYFWGFHLPESVDWEIR